MDKLSIKYYNALNDLRDLLMEDPRQNVRSFLSHRKIDHNVYNVLIASDIIKAIEIGSLWIGSKPTERMVRFVRNTNKHFKRGDITAGDIQSWSESSRVRLKESYVKIIGIKIKIYHEYY